MDWVFEYPEPNAKVEEVIQKCGSVPDRQPNASPECWQLEGGLTTRHRRAIVLDIGACR
jgi:hypothetical protein